MATLPNVTVSTTHRTVNELSEESVAVSDSVRITNLSSATTIRGYVNTTATNNNSTYFEISTVGKYGSVYDITDLQAGENLFLYVASGTAICNMEVI
jgi:hypothetical protein